MDEEFVNPMYSMLCSEIGAGAFDLTTMLDTIDTMFVAGRISAEERLECIQQARENAKPDIRETDADFEQRIRTLESTLETVLTRLQALEQEAEIEPAEPTESYPEFEVGHWYYAGDKITFNGKRYTCIAPEGVVCVWTPSVMPAYWKEEE